MALICRGKIDWYQSEAAGYFAKSAFDPAPYSFWGVVSEGKNIDICEKRIEWFIFRKTVSVAVSLSWDKRRSKTFTHRGFGMEFRPDSWSVVTNRWLHLQFPRVVNVITHFETKLPFAPTVDDVVKAFDEL